MSSCSHQGKLADESFIFKEITWEVPSFLSLPPLVDSAVRSVEFTFANATWTLCLYPFGQRKYDTQSFVDIMICRQHSPEPTRQVFYQITSKTRRNKEYRVFKHCHTFCYKDNERGAMKYIEHSQLVSEQKSLLRKGALAIVCRMRIRNAAAVQGNSQNDTAVKPDKNIKREVAVQTTTISENLPSTANNKVLRDLQDLLANGECSDIKILVKGHKFEAHRSILCARSSVFASMLRHGASENARPVSIEVCDPEDVPGFLHFLYCGSTERLTPQNMCSLYKLADTYDVPDLKAECSKLMKSHLTVENFCDVFSLSLECSDPDLVVQSAEFFKKNLSKIIVTMKWQVFLSENTALGNELLIKALAVGQNSDPKICV